MTYEIVCSKGLDAEKTAIVKDFLTYFASDRRAELARGSWLRPAAERTADQGQDAVAAIL